MHCAIKFEVCQAIKPSGTIHNIYKPIRTRTKDILIQISFLSSRSVLQFSCFRNFHFRHFGISDFGFRSMRLSDLLSFPTPDFQNSDLLYPPGPHSTVVTHNYGGTWHVNEGPRRFLTTSSVPPLSLSPFPCDRGS
jgi:hypothetical protein